MSLCTPSLLRPSPPLWLEEICQKLQDSDQSLSTLDLSHPRIDDVFARLVANALSENKVVTTVILSCFALVDDGAHALGKTLMEHKLLSKLQLRDLRNQREINIFFELLAQHGNIEEISLRHARICMQSVQSVVRFIHKHPKLEEFRIVDSLIDDASQKELFRGVKGHPSLKRLFMVNVGISSVSAPFLADMLEESSLRELCLCENDLEDEGVSALVTSIAQNKTLRRLDLRSNGISDKAALSLQGMLVARTSLSALILSNNNIDDLGVTAISRGLAHPSCNLETLDLSQNSFGSKGVFALARMLRNNKMMKNLNLSFNAFGDQGATTLAAVLVRNRTLHALHMRHCGISDEGARGISQYLPSIHGLKEMILAKNSITTEGATALLHGIRQNVEIEYLHVDDKVNATSREILHYTRLNKAGRRVFLGTNAMFPSLWPCVYGRISSDLDMLYYFVKEAPHLIDPLTNHGVQNLEALEGP